MENQPLQRCDNCRKDFPQSKIATHFGYCRRNIKKCQICYEMIDINFKQDHEQQFHKKEQCPHCKKIFPSNDLKNHDKVCSSKPKYCQYCDLNVPIATYDTHFKACEARTKPCTKCNKPITNKEYLIHIVSCTGPVEVPKNYKDHIVQQQKKFELNNNQINQYGNSREKPAVYNNGGSANYIKEENKYANIVFNGADKNDVIQHKITYIPKIPSEQRQYNNLKPTYQDKPVNQVKQTNQYKSSINAPKSKLQQKREAPLRQKREEVGKIVPQPIQPNRRQIKGRQDYKKEAYIAPRNGNLINYQGGSGTFDPIRKNANSREAARVPVNNQKIFGNQQPGIIKGAPVKQNRSIQKGIGSRKDVEQGKFQFANSNSIKNQVIIEKPRDKSSQFPANRITQNPRDILSPLIKPKYDQYSEYDSYEQTNDFGVSVEEQQMQQIIEQSLKEQAAFNNKANKRLNNKKDTADFGEDMFNQSFIEQQKAIEDYLGHNKHKK